MKKMLLFALVMMLGIVLAACGSNAQPMQNDHNMGSEDGSGMNMPMGNESGESGMNMPMGNESGESGMNMPMGNEPVMKAGALEFYSPMAMAAKTGETTGGFMVIKNTGATADRLLSASCEAAMMTQVHETVVENDVMTMREVSAIEIPAGGMVELKHGGYHIMLMNLKQDVKAGETTACTLKFEQAGEVMVSLPVMSR